MDNKQRTGAAKNRRYLAKLLAVALAVLMVVSLVPAMAFAKTGEQAKTQATTQAKTSATSTADTQAVEDETGVIVEMNPDIDVASNVQEYIKDIQAMIEDSEMFRLPELTEETIQSLLNGDGLNGDALNGDGFNFESLKSDDLAKAAEELLKGIDLTDIYQTGRILVRTTEALAEQFVDAAKEVLYFNGDYILQFTSEKATKDAYKKLVKQYGENNVFLDRVFQLDQTEFLGNLAKAGTNIAQNTVNATVDLLSGLSAAQKANGNVTKTQTNSALQAAAQAGQANTAAQAQATISAKGLKGKNGYLSWGVRSMGMDKVTTKLNSRRNKPEVKVAVLDTGVNYFDGSLEGRIADGAFDFVLFNPVAMDWNGHGTFCEGVIAESTPNNVKVLPVKVMNALGLGNSLSIYMGLWYAYMQDADVLNMSLNEIDTPIVHVCDTPLKQLYKKGCVTVVAAGNNKENANDFYPGNSKYTICVGALKSNGRVDRSYSNYGSCVDFAAPGTEVAGLYNLFGVPTVSKMTGTSMATPHVAAAAALIKTVYPSYNQKQVLNVLKANCVDIESRGKDPWSGYGRINLTGFANRL